MKLLSWTRVVAGFFVALLVPAIVVTARVYAPSDVDAYVGSAVAIAFNAVPIVILAILFDSSERTAIKPFTQPKIGGACGIVLVVFFTVGHVVVLAGASLVVFAFLCADALVSKRLRVT